MAQKYFITAAYYLAFILLGLTIAVEGPTLLKLAEHTASAINEISLVFFFSSLGYLAGSYTSGKLYDRLPGHQLMSGMLVLLGVSIIFVPLANSLFGAGRHPSWSRIQSHAIRLNRKRGPAGYRR